VRLHWLTCAILCLAVPIGAQEDWLEYSELSGNTEVEELLQGLPDWGSDCLNAQWLLVIADYEASYGPINDWEELYRIPGIEPFQIQCLYEKYGQRYTTTSSNGSQLVARLRHDFRPLRSGKEYGTDQYGRVQFTNPRIQLFFQWETDREEWAIGNPFIPDFLSGYIRLKRKNSNSEWLIGDFSMHHGQGLVSYAGLFASPSAGLNQLIRVGKGINGYRSKIESGFYRGVAYSTSVDRRRRVNISLWASAAPLDASLKGDSLSRYWQSLDMSGFHRTETELEKKGALSWYSTGASASVPIGSIDASLVIRTDHFSHPFYPGDDLFRAGLPGYSDRQTIQLAHHGNLGVLSTWGETAWQTGGGFATLHGVSHPLTSSWSYGIIGRYASSSFYAPFSGGFFKRTPPRNEWGGFFTVSGKLYAGVTVNAFCNIWHFPGIRYLFDRPVEGSRSVLIINWSKRKRFRTQLQLLYQRESQQQYEIGPYSSRYNNLLRCRFHYERTLNTTWRLSGRWEISSRPGEIRSGSGQLVFWDCVYNPMQSPWRIATRVSWSAVPDYTLRISAFEYDVLGRFRIQAFSNEAIHHSLSLRYKTRFGLTVDLSGRAIYAGDFHEKRPQWNASLQLQYRLERE
jgi:hypothetical protein